MVLAAEDMMAWFEGMSLLAANAGRMTFPGMCGVSFDTGGNPDPNIVGYATFKSILLALLPIWEASYAQAYTANLKEHFPKQKGPLDPSWMTYLSAPLAAEITPPSGVAVERIDGSGLLMSATVETFDASNAAHLAASEKILQALAPLNEKMRPR